ncbi:alpha/beta fold hydrolase [Hahella sp. CCB-MM4]|uniref:alpha/beta fold hydrolase n=1 Tax=Hahella sp. (strain CCB-MM4) TaxID=1926491 RepID=UPI000B9ACB95|nr:alpha/beta hydrolase [Hahella sp. CCB-MM4]
MTHSLLNMALKEYASNKVESDIDQFSPQYVKVGKFDIRYVRHEKANAPTLVLLNGLPQSIRMWESAWSVLCQNFNLLAFDIPGFGLTKADESDMSPRKLSQVVIQVFNHFGISKAHLVGPDVGAPIALATAINYPNRLESINIFDGPGSYPPKMSPILNAVIKLRVVRWLAKGLNKKSVMETNFKTAVKEGYHHYRPTKRAIKEYYDIAFDEQSHRCAISFFGTYSKDLPWIEERLKEIRIPTLITWGKLDPFVLVDNADYLSKRIPLSKVVVFENASHFSSEDAGAAYQDAIINWCQREYKQVYLDIKGSEPAHKTPIGHGVLS